MPQCNGSTRFSRAELLQASMELRHHALGYVKSMALRCAVKLGVANAIHRRGGVASLDDLLAELFLPSGSSPVPTATTAFKMTHGEDLWGVLGRDAALRGFFDGALASDTRFVMDMAIRVSPKVFDGIASLVDVPGGAGAAARAVAAAFPRIKCTVLDLPQLAPADGLVDYVAGDMMEFIPPADAVLLKVKICNVYS
nr:unnamed protein product [Digitaria exilis]